MQEPGRGPERGGWSWGHIRKCAFGPTLGFRFYSKRSVFGEEVPLSASLSSWVRGLICSTQLTVGCEKREGGRDPLFRCGSVGFHFLFDEKCEMFTLSQNKGNCEFCFTICRADFMHF